MIFQSCIKVLSVLSMLELSSSHPSTPYPEKGRDQSTYDWYFIVSEE